MLDILLLASSAALTAYVSSPRNVDDVCGESTNIFSIGGGGRIRESPSPTSFPSSSAFDDGGGGVGGVPSGGKGEGDDVDAAAVLATASAWIFRASLLLSLWLFSLGILEAAPSSSLLVFDNGPAAFAVWYRRVLWAQCAVLLFFVPSAGGIALASRFCPTAKRREDNDETNAKSDSVDEKEKQRRWHLVMRIAGICVKFALVAMRYLFLWTFGGVKKVVLPSAMRRDSSAGSSRGRSRVTSLGEKCKLIRSVFHRLGRHFSVGTLLGLFIAVSLSSVSLTALASIVMTNDDETNGDLSSHSSPLKFMVKLLCAFGVVVASLLNGFGCASLPHSNLAGMFLEPASLATLAGAEEEYVRALRAWEDRCLALMDVRQSVGAARAPSRLTISFRECCQPKCWDKSTNDGKQSREIHEEVLFLETLIGDLADDVREMKHSRQLALAARTPLGRIRGVLGVICSVALIIRVGLAVQSVLYNAVLGSQRLQRSFHSRNDPVTLALLWLTTGDAAAVVLSEDRYDALSQAASLFLAGLLSVAQVRTFLRTADALGRKWNRTFGVASLCSSESPSCLGSSPSLSQASAAASPRGTDDGLFRSLRLLIAAFVMGSYFLSCVVLTKTNLPLEYRASFSDAVGRVDFAFDVAVTNALFAASACWSALVLGLLFGIQQDQSARHRLLEVHLNSVNSTRTLCQTA